ncbi:glycine oxidase ThiO [Sinomonas cellulolyticus]|uniref:glycine oxidase n=1 Tax=Sinomonas cellulolyticus TaxID=2801916 RepID=A0ABS1JZJ4_9MICC|nr:MULTISPECIES: glycine oxidase ThiO [Sinomonas]MBL0704826.1 glycine oxidase ThiO [Sinomonas cellulolyticus]GHG47296.1 glycine oxidase ThiO [Sinomonas sp. KCTC 49339]
MENRGGVRPEAVRSDVIVVGAGVIGLGIAWEAARTGRRVTVVDPEPGSGASYAAAGMLAAVSEYHYQEEALLELTLRSAELWPAFADAAGPDCGYLLTPTLCLAADGADRAAFADLRAAQEAHGLAVRPLTVREARSEEPLLAPGISGAFEIQADHQVDPRRLVAALLARLEDRFGPDAVVRRRAAGLLWEAPSAGVPGGARRVAGVVLEDGRELRAEETIVANGLGARELAGLPVALPLRPVYGDILRLRVPEPLRPLVTATVRGLVRGKPVYIVPREDGTVVIGATQREDGSGAVSAGGVYELLRDAQALVPAVAELELYETTARARPGTPDNAPLLGRVRAGDGGRPGTRGEIPGLIIATGFFRHGVLLTPVAAHVCVGLLEGRADPRWDAFAPDRCAPRRAGAPAAPAAATGGN